MDPVCNYNNILLNTERRIPQEFRVTNIIYIFQVVCIVVCIVYWNHLFLIIP